MIQVVKLTKEEQYKQYMKMKKSELATFLVNRDEINGEFSGEPPSNWTITYNRND